MIGHEVMGMDDMVASFCLLDKPGTSLDVENGKQITALPWAMTVSKGGNHP
jgi:hypothetical protein